MASNADRHEGFMSSLIIPDRLLCPLSFIFSGYQDSFAGAKRPECEVNSPPSRAQVKNGGVILLLHIYAVMAWTGTNLPLIFKGDFIDRNLAYSVAGMGLKLSPCMCMCMCVYVYVYVSLCE